MILQFPGWSEMSAWAITLAKQSMRMANGRIGTKHSRVCHIDDEEVVDRSVVRNPDTTEVSEASPPYGSRKCASSLCSRFKHLVKLR